MTTIEINYDRIRDAGDHRMPHGFRQSADDGSVPPGVVRLFDVPYGEQVTDARGERFRLLGPGAMQGTVVMRDRNRRMFYAEGSMFMLYPPRKAIDEAIARDGFAVHVTSLDAIEAIDEDGDRIVRVSTFRVGENDSLIGLRVGSADVLLSDTQAAATIAALRAKLDR